MLAVLIWQVAVNRAQAKVAEHTLDLAKQQYEDSARRMTQDRIDAVLPALSVTQFKQGEGTYIDGEDREHPIPTITYELENFGRGPAANISVCLCLNGGDTPVQPQRVQGIGAGQRGQVTLWFFTQADGELRISYEDLFGTRYNREFDVAWTCNPDGEMYCALYESTR